MREEGNADRLEDNRRQNEYVGQRDAAARGCRRSATATAIRSQVEEIALSFAWLNLGEEEEEWIFLMKLFRKTAPAVLAASLIASLFSVVPQAQAISTSIVIAEVYNASLESDEWVTIANIGAADIDLTNWALQDYSGSGNPQTKWHFPSGTIIEAGELLVVEKTTGNSGAAAQGVAAVTGGNFNFAGSSDRLDLYNANNALVDGIAWGSANTTEGFQISGSSASNTSFERLTATDTDTAGDWQRVASNVQAYAWAPLPGPSNDAPIVQSVAPAENAVNVPVGADLTVTFDKNVVVNSGSVTVVNVTDGLTFDTVAASSPQVSVVQNQLQISLADLQPGKKYEVTLPAGFVVDDATFSMQNGLKKWSFTTAPALFANIAAVRASEEGSIASVRGEVTAVLGSHNAWIQDGTAGIRLYQAGGGLQGLAVGQEVVVSGTVENYNNDLELNVTSLEVRPDDLIAAPQPQVVAVNQVGEANEGSLVKVEDVWVKSDYTPGAGGIVVTDGTNDLVVYAQAGSALKTFLQSLPKSPANPFDIVGISSVFNTTIELMPRSEADVTPS